MDFKLRDNKKTLKCSLFVLLLFQLGISFEIK